MSASITEFLGPSLARGVAIALPVLYELLKVLPFAVGAVLLAYLDRRRIVGRFRPWMATQGLRTFVFIYVIAAAYWLAVRQPWH